MTPDPTPDPAPGACRRLSPAAARRLDRLAIEYLGLPGVVLMENAGRGAAEALWAWYPARRGERLTGPVAVLCGPGNNGGDGFVLARHLANRGVAVTLFSVRDLADLRGDAAVFARVCHRMGLPWSSVATEAALDMAAADWARAQVLVDAGLGTGTGGPLRGPWPGIVAAMERLPASASGGPLRVALDLPTGLVAPGHASAIEGPVVRADLTLTFEAEKTAFDAPGARALLGEVQVIPIGVPPSLVDAAWQALTVSEDGDDTSSMDPGPGAGPSV